MSSVKSVKIVGLGKYLPPKVITNFDLEKMVDTSDEWITTRTGIKERRIAEKEPASQLGTKAARIALKRASLKPRDLELIIVATITPDNFFPSTACYLQKNLKAEKSAVFDISAACAGFVYALGIGWSFLKSGLYKNCLVIGTEVLSTITDWEDRSTCVLFGDGAGAAVLVPTRSKSGLLSLYLGGQGSLGELLILPAGGSREPPSLRTVSQRLHYIKMQGNELFRTAVRVMVSSAWEVLKKVHLKPQDVDLLIPHQANMRIIKAVGKRLDIPPSRIFVNIDRYGNMSSASTVIALCEAWETGRIKKGDIVLLDAFGGGLVWGSCLIRWI